MSQPLQTLRSPLTKSSHELQSQVYRLGFQEGTTQHNRVYRLEHLPLQCGQLSLRERFMSQLMTKRLCWEPLVLLFFHKLILLLIRQQNFLTQSLDTTNHQHNLKYFEKPELGSEEPAFSNCLTNLSMSSDLREG